MRRSQTATEYLVIVAIVIIIAIIVISILGDVPFLGGSSNKQVMAAKLQTAPVGVVDYAVTDRYTQFTVLNNKRTSVEIDSITINNQLCLLKTTTDMIQITATDSLVIPTGKKKDLYCFGVHNNQSGESYEYDIDITYSDTELSATYTQDDDYALIGTVAEPIASCGNASDPFHGGSGSTADPYQICNCDQLQDMSTGLGSRYMLITDIDCSETSTWNSNGTHYLGFDPVGDFSGRLYGRGYEISDLYIYRPAENDVGLFGRFRGWIDGVNLKDVDITGNNEVGGFAGEYYSGGTGRITYSSVEGLVSGDVSVGGFTGGNTGSQVLYINNSYFSGTVTGTDSYTGGFVGAQAGHFIIYNSYSLGTVNGKSTNGGIVARANAGAYLYNVYSTMDINANGGSGTITGGLIGYFGTVVSDSFATGDINAAGWRYGGLVGDTITTCSNNYWDTTTTGRSTARACTSGSATGIASASVGYDYWYDADNPPMSSWDFDDVWVENTDSTPTLRYVG